MPEQKHFFNGENKNMPSLLNSKFCENGRNDPQQNKDILMNSRIQKLEPNINEEEESKHLPKVKQLFEVPGTKAY